MKAEYAQTKVAFCVHAADYDIDDNFDEVCAEIKGVGYEVAEVAFNVTGVYLVVDFSYLPSAQLVEEVRVKISNLDKKNHEN